MKHHLTSSKLGLGSCICITVGGMIGSAIFSLCGLTIDQAGPGALLSWLIAAVIMLFYGLITAELASLFPKSGGVFVFPEKILGNSRSTGKFWGWISVWGYINSNIAAIAFSSGFIATSLEAMFPDLIEYRPAIIFGSLIAILIISMLSISSAGKINNLLVGALLASLLLFTIMSLLKGGWSADRLVPFFSQGRSGLFGFVGAVPIAMLGYGAVVSISFMAADVKNPSKNIPKSIRISTLIVAILYGMVILAIIGILPVRLLGESQTARMAPLGAVCSTGLAVYPWIAIVVLIASVLAMFTTMLVLCTVTSRAIESAASSGLLPALLSKTKKGGIPVYAAFAVIFISGFIACFAQFTEQIINLGAIFSIITLSINCISLMVARKKFACPARLLNAPKRYALPAAVLLILVCCYIPDIIQGGWSMWIYTLIWYAFGLIIYLFRRKSANQPTATE